MESVFGRPVSERRYYSVTGTHDGKHRTFTVGGRGEHAGETVAAIFHAGHEGGPFTVCAYGSESVTAYVMPSDGHATEFDPD